MDAVRFDAFTRTLGSASSRRIVLRAGLGAAVGLFAALRGEAPGESAKKPCKGLKGKKKKKCLAKGKPDTVVECRLDRDCPDKTQGCQGGRCQRICPAGACPGCSNCLVKLESDGDRTRLCAGQVTVPPSILACGTDADCPQTEPLCILFDIASCTAAQCGTCVTAVGPCNAPECAVDGDCPDLSESCQGGVCRPVCPNDACGTCPICAVRFAANGNRAQICADTLSASISGLNCTTDTDCPATDPTCIGVAATLCAQPPCRQCFAVTSCAP